MEISLATNTKTTDLQDRDARPVTFKASETSQLFQSLGPSRRWASSRATAGDWPDSADRTLQQVAGLRVTRRTRLPRKASNYPASVGLKKKEVKTTTTSTTTTPGFTQKHRSGN